MPSGSLLALCKRYIAERAVNLEPAARTVRAVWKVEYGLGWRYALRPTVQDAPVLREFILLQVNGFGSSHQETTGLSRLRLDCIGLDAFHLERFPLAYQIAALDAVASVFVPPPTREIRLAGSNTEKLIARTDVIVEEVLAHANRINRRRPRIVIVGALESLITRLVRERRFQVQASDADTTVVGRSYSGVIVESAQDTIRLIRGSDVAVVTGMVLATDTADEILEAARKGGARLVLFMQTGANLVEPCLAAGAHAVVCEPYPFYFMPGESIVSVYRASEGQ